METKNNQQLRWIREYADYNHDLYFFANIKNKWLALERLNHCQRAWFYRYGD